MSDSLSDLHDDYDDYVVMCKQRNIEPKSMWGESDWLDDFFKWEEERRNEKQTVLEKDRVL